ncbi:hypothetical protein HMPREF1320_0692 [Capnocytophaga sp. oral taxon 335 str. F0486]|nr:hypothetical protein HMPREF1320_0692 [Capnocytophaga sp. oral taxon 335 str. F0486]
MSFSSKIVFIFLSFKKATFYTKQKKYLYKQRCKGTKFFLIIILFLGK